MKKYFFLNLWRRINFNNILEKYFMFSPPVNLTMGEFSYKNKQTKEKKFIRYIWFQDLFIFFVFKVINTYQIVINVLWLESERRKKGRVIFYCFFVSLCLFLYQLFPIFLSAVYLFNLFFFSSLSDWKVQERNMFFIQVIVIQGVTIREGPGGFLGGNEWVM